MWIAIVSGFVLAAAAPGLVRLLPRGGPRMLSLGPAVLAAVFVDGFRRTAEGPPLREAWPWFPDLGIRLSFLGDPLAFVFGILIAGIGAVVVLYSGAYLRGDPRLGRFLAALLAFMAAMLGVVFADNLFTLAAAWGLTGLWSFFLIGHSNRRVEARKAALQTLIVTETGALALLAGFLLMASAGGSAEISVLSARPEALKDHSLYPVMLALVLAGAFTKSAQWPFHFWLPNAMEAPTPASAYLHAATLVKAGVYLVLRLGPLLGGTPAWTAVLVAVGATTLVVGAWHATRQEDLKRILAYTTVAALGASVLLAGLGTGKAVAASVAFLVAHALYKGALFLVVGIVDHETGTRALPDLGGLRRAMPVTAAIAGLAGLSMASLPPAAGFLAKEMLYEASMDGSGLVTAFAVLGNGLLLAATLALLLGPFLGRAPRPGRPHDPGVELLAGPAVLALLGLAGLRPDWVAALVRPAATAAAGAPVALDLALWHGWTPPLLLSLLTLAAGAILYLARPLLRRIRGPGWSADRLYAAALSGVNGLAVRQTRLLQHGSLPGYLATVLVAIAVLAGAALLAENTFALPGQLADAGLFELAVVGVMAGAAAAAVVVRDVAGAVVAMGLIGYGAALLFLLYGAPDLAITQLVVESLTVILFVLVLRGRPQRRRSDEPSSTPGGLAAALATGAVMTAVLLAVRAFPPARRISDYFAEASVAEGHGRNVVNVILVDFRGIDTLGEIVVLATAATGAFLLLRRAGEAGP